MITKLFANDKEWIKPYNESAQICLDYVNIISKRFLTPRKPEGSEFYDPQYAAFLVCSSVLSKALIPPSKLMNHTNCQGFTNYYKNCNKTIFANRMGFQLEDFPGF